MIKTPTPLDAPTTTWTVWLHVQYHEGTTEVWTGTEYHKALTKALEVIDAADGVGPIHPDWTVAAHVTGERTTDSWRIESGEDTALVFITSKTTTH